MPSSPRDPLDLLLRRVEDLDPELAADLRIAWEGTAEDFCGSVTEAPAAEEKAQRRGPPTGGTRYRVLHDPTGNPIQLGPGGFARVLRARDERLGREVALKLPRSNAPKIEGDSLFEEAVWLATLSHPGLLPVHDLVAWESGQPAIIMPIAPGGTLADKVASRSGPVTLDAALADLLRAFRRVVETVDYLHGVPVFHGDIKGTNVLLGEHGEVYLHDLGAAVAAGVHDEDQTVGTSGWMPGPGHPARRRGAPRDIWQLGALLATICTGASAPGDTDLALDDALGLRAPTSCITWPTALGALRSVARRCMTADSHHPATTQEILRALDAWDAGRVVVGHQYRPIEWLQLQMKQHRSALAAAVIVLVSSAALMGEGWRRSREADALAADVEELAATASAGTVAVSPDPARARALAIERLRLGESAIARGVLVASASSPTPTLAWSAPDVACQWLTPLTATGRWACLTDEGMHVFSPEGEPMDGWPVPPQRSRPLWSGNDNEVVVVGPNFIERWAQAGLLTSQPLRQEEVTATGAAPNAMLVVGYRDGVVETREPESLVVRGAFTVAPGAINALAFVGSEIIAGSVGDWLRALDPLTSAVRDVLPRGLGARFLVVHGSDLVVAGRRAGGDPDLVRINPVSGAQLGTWAADGVDVRRVAASGDRLVTSGAVGPVTVWTPNGDAIARISTFDQRVSSVAIAPSNDSVAVSFDSGGLFVWSMPAGSGRQGAAHFGPVSGVATHGNLVASTGEDAQLRTWSLPDMVPGCAQPVADGYASGLAAFSDGRFVLGDSQGGVYVASPDCALHKVASLGTARIRRPELTPDEGLLAVGDSNRGVYVLDTHTWQIEHSARFQQNTAGVAFSPDGTRLYVTSFGDELLTVDLASGTTTYEQVPDSGPAGRLFTGLLHLGNVLVAGGRNGELLRWSAGAVTSVHGLPLRAGQVTSLAYDPSSRRIAAGLSNGTLVLTREDGAVEAVWPAHRGATWSLAFAEDGTSLVSGGADGRVLNWRLTGFDQGAVALAESLRRELGLVADGTRVTLVGR